MSSISRLAAVGVPAVGLAAALALGVSPALASGAAVDQALRPVVAATGYGEPDATDEAPTRGQKGYGTPAATTAPTATAASTPDVDDTDTPGTDTPDTPGTGTPGTPDTDTPTRGGNSYGPTPGVSADTVKPSAAPTTSSPSGALPANVTPGGGVSAGGALPVTGAPTGTVISLGALMVAAGAASVWYTRRRRTA